MLNHATLDFAWQHRHDDTTRLLLGKTPREVDMRASAQQIEGWQTAQTKWPSLSANPLFLYPPRINREQASSEATATYKAALASKFKIQNSKFKIADLTGGMGIDTMALAKVATSVDYYELNAKLCELMQYNATTLGLDTIAVYNADSIALGVTDSPDTWNRYDFALIDPARRDTAGRRVTSFEDCTPDILSAMPYLRQVTRRLMIKASPMVDIAMALKQLPPVCELHIVALRGECKELLFVIDFETTPDEPEMHCVNLNSGTSPLVYHPSAARAATAAVLPIDSPQPHYLFEPDATIMKAGCHALVASRHGLSLLSNNSHIYCGMQTIDGFPGRTFEVIAETVPTRRALTALLPDWKANIISRNHPISADAMRRQLRLADGGDIYIIATRVATRHTAYVCRRK